MVFVSTNLAYKLETNDWLGMQKKLLMNWTAKTADRHRSLGALHVLPVEVKATCW